MSGAFGSGGLVQYQSIIASSNSVTSIQAEGPSTFKVTGSNHHTLSLPNASLCILGRIFTFKNRTTKVLTITNFLGAVILRVGPKSDGQVAVEDISLAAGVWDVEIGPAWFIEGIAGEPIAEGDAVYMTQNGPFEDPGRPSGTFWKAEPNLPHRKNFWGIALQSVAAGEPFLYTNRFYYTSGLAVGQDYWLDAANRGKWINSKPQPPLYLGFYEAFVGKAVDAGTLQIDVTATRRAGQVGQPDSNTLFGEEFKFIAPNDKDVNLESFPGNNSDDRRVRRVSNIQDLTDTSAKEVVAEIVRSDPSGPQGGNVVIRDLYALYNNLSKVLKIDRNGGLSLIDNSVDPNFGVPGLVVPGVGSFGVLNVTSLSVSGNQSVGGNLAVAGTSQFAGPTSGFGVVPVGAVVSIFTMPGGFAIPASGVVSSGWMRADGALVPSGNSITAGTATPNISDSRFIMGSTTSSVGGGTNASNGGVTQAVFAGTAVARNSWADSVTPDYASGDLEISLEFDGAANLDHTHSMSHVHNYVLIKPDLSAYGRADRLNINSTKITTSTAGQLHGASSGSDRAGFDINITPPPSDLMYYTAGPVNLAGNIASTGNTGIVPLEVTDHRHAGSKFSFSIPKINFFSSSFYVPAGNISTQTVASGENRPAFISTIYLIRVN